MPKTIKVDLECFIDDELRPANSTFTTDFFDDKELPSWATEVDGITEEVETQPEANTVADDHPLKTKTVKELKQICKELGISNYSKLKEDDLILAIESAQSAGVGEEDPVTNTDTAEGTGLVEGGDNNPAVDPI